MQFDWFTFGAQIVNFVILLVLLQRVLYKPIMRAMQAREEQIAARYQEAEAEAQKAHHEAELFHEKRQDLEEQRADLLADAVAATQLRRNELLDEARQEADATRARWFAAIAREKAVYLQELRQRVSTQVFTIVRRTLRDLANATLEAQIVTVFGQRLQQLDEQEEIALAEAMQNSQRQAIVRSAFGLDAAQQTTLTQILRDLFAGMVEGGEIQVTFEDAPDLLCGIELQVYGHRVSWSLHDYVETLEQQLDDLFDGDGTGDAPVTDYHEVLVAA